jgi:hypothetical protein
MGAHWIFLTIGNLVSPLSFPFAGQGGENWPAPSEQKICPFSAAQAGAVKPWDLLSRSCHLRDKMFILRRGVN